MTNKMWHITYCRYPGNKGNSYYRVLAETAEEASEYFKSNPFMRDKEIKNIIEGDMIYNSFDITVPNSEADRLEVVLKQNTGDGNATEYSIIKKTEYKTTFNFSLDNTVCLDEYWTNTYEAEYMIKRAGITNYEITPNIPENLNSY